MQTDSSYDEAKCLQMVDLIEAAKAHFLAGKIVAITSTDVMFAPGTKGDKYRIWVALQEEGTLQGHVMMLTGSVSMIDYSLKRRLAAETWNYCSCQDRNDPASWVRHAKQRAAEASDFRDMVTYRDHLTMEMTGCAATRVTGVAPDDGSIPIVAPGEKAGPAEPERWSDDW